MTTCPPAPDVIWILCSWLFIWWWSNSDLANCSSSSNYSWCAISSSLRICISSSVSY